MLVQHTLACDTSSDRAASQAARRSPKLFLCDTPSFCPFSNSAEEQQQTDRGANFRQFGQGCNRLLAGLKRVKIPSSLKMACMTGSTLSILVMQPLFACVNFVETAEFVISAKCR